jgi:hypothetical protein
MDISNFKTSDWLIIGGGLGTFVFGFFSWVTVSGFGFSSAGGNAFDFFWTGTIPWILVIASAVITVLLSLEVLKAEQAPWPLIILGATSLAALLLIIRVIFNPIEGRGFIEAAGGSVGRGAGMYLSALAGIVAAAGGYIAFTESGGNLGELGKSLQSKTAGASSESAPPPPPAD